MPSLTPDPWTGQDIGAVTLAGGDSYDKNTYTLVGSGVDIGGAADAFHYVYQPASGNCFISAQVATEEIFTPSAEAGVMIRNSLDPADMEVSVVATPTNGILFQWRSAYGEATSSSVIAGLTTPCWVQLVRSNNIFTAAYSPNGQTWTTIGSPITVAMVAMLFHGPGSRVERLVGKHCLRDVWQCHHHCAAAALRRRPLAGRFDRQSAIE